VPDGAARAWHLSRDNHRQLQRVPVDAVDPWRTLGIAAQNWMPYAAGGYGNATYHFNGVASTGATIEQADAILNGWYVGGGLEVMLAGHKNWSFGVDYRHFVFTRGTVNATSTPVEPVTVSAHADVVTARLNFHIGG